MAGAQGQGRVYNFHLQEQLQLLAAQVSIFALEKQKEPPNLEIIVFKSTESAKQKLVRSPARISSCVEAPVF